MSNRPALPPEIARRRTFAIISHPDAGKTTLTEKFLLYGGAIQMAGQVRAKGEARRTRSDFMKMEQERGISVSASAMSFDFERFRFNLVDTPGHSDFSEDTYRTLTAVDAAVMVIDGAKGVESQTRKLFEVCRLRDLPILTFCNKMDRESRDTFEIIDEIQENLAIDVTPASWPIGEGRDFLGCYDLLHDRLELMDRADRNRVAQSVRIDGLDDPKMAEHVPAGPAGEAARGGRDGARADARRSTRRRVLEGTMTPIWFGSAINSFGVKRADGGDRPLRRPSRSRNPPSRARSRPRKRRSTGFVFKVQANMDPKHRDRVAFVRLASGHFERGMKLTARALEEADGGDQPGPVPRLRPRAGGGGLGGRHHRHPEPRPAADRRHADRGRGAAGDRDPVLRAGAAADLPRGRPDEGQAPGKGADAVRRGGRGQGVQADDRLGLRRRRRRRAAVRGAGEPDRAGIRTAGAVRGRRSSPPPAGSPGRRTSSRRSSRPTSRTSRTTTTATWSTSRACNGTSTGSSATMPT